MSAFASVEHGGKLWAKRYPSLQHAVDEARRLRLIDKLFATAAVQYVRKTRSNCIAPLSDKTDPRKIEAAGFRLAGAGAEDLRGSL
jgi:hypothetical protein